jgi:hypothetical protein
MRDNRNIGASWSAVRVPAWTASGIAAPILAGAELVPSTQEQLELFASPTHAVSEAMDRINDRWGEFVVTPALMMGMDDIILDRISFGGVKELRELYE